MSNLEAILDEEVTEEDLLYGDLEFSPIPNKKQENEGEKEKNGISKAKKKISLTEYKTMKKEENLGEELEKVMEENTSLKKQAESLRKENKVLRKNISVLFVTAKHELSRKNSLIQELRENANSKKTFGRPPLNHAPGKGIKRVREGTEEMRRDDHRRNAPVRVTDGNIILERNGGKLGWSQDKQAQGEEKREYFPVSGQLPTSFQSRTHQDLAKSSILEEKEDGSLEGGEVRPIPPWLRKSRNDKTQRSEPFSYFSSDQYHQYVPDTKYQSRNADIYEDRRRML